MVEEMVKVEFVVKYKKNPHYAGEFNENLKPGIHGKFDNKGDAEKAKEVCRKHLNEQHSLKSKPNELGQIVETPHIVAHDVSVVWIEEYHDGVLQSQQKKAKAEAD